MDKNQNHSLLLEIFEELRAGGKIRTQGDFAQLLWLSRNYISRALNGYDEALTPMLMSKAVRLRDQVAKGETPAIPHQIAPAAAERSGGIVIPPETLELYTSLARTCDRLSATVDRLLGAVTPAGTGAGQGAKKSPSSVEWEP